MTGEEYQNHLLTDAQAAGGVALSYIDERHGTVYPQGGSEWQKWL